MEPVDGFNASVELPPRHRADARLRHAMSMSMIDALARLGAVDHQKVGLSEFGKPDGFLERQVPRWMSELESYAEFTGYEGPAFPALERIGDWLGRNRPSVWTPGISHGDYSVANVMFDPVGPEVAAIIDWEMATIGDPLLDLGWMLSLWPATPDSDDLMESAFARAGGLPAERELVAHYAERSTRSVAAIDWYVVLACLKLGIILEGTYARAKAGKAGMTEGERLHRIAHRLIDRAHRRVAG